MKATCAAIVLLTAAQLFASFRGAPAIEASVAKALRTLGDDIGLPTATSVVNASEEPQSGVIDISASKFQFSPSEITLRKGRPIKIRLTSTDGAHGLAIPGLKIDVDVGAGGTAEVTLTPRVAGTFKAFCDHYCGIRHGDMRMTVVVE